MRAMAPTSRRFSPRHMARRAALQALYAHQISGESDPQKLVADVLRHARLPKSAREFLQRLVKAAVDREKLADSVIQKVAENWDIDRISVVDRNILRLGIAEFLDFPDISYRVTIDEAVELAKEFGSADSSKFVNGVLDAALRKLREMGLVSKEDG